MSCGQRLQTLEPGEVDEGYKVDDLHRHRINFDAFLRFSA
jgi:hypothetical protein